MTKNLSARDGVPPFELLARKAHKVPQILKPIATAAGYMTLLLKITHVHALTIYTGHRTGKPHPTGQLSQSEGTMQAAEDELLATFLPDYTKILNRMFLCVH